MFKSICLKYYLGDVYYGVNVLTDEPIAIKLENVNTGHPKLRHEYLVYKALGQSDGVPRVLSFSTERGYSALVTERLGPSLEVLLAACGRRLGLKTVLMLADQLVSS